MRSASVLTAAVASTGPRSFERGETWPRAGRDPRRACFNGAALFRARRGSVRLLRVCSTQLLQRGRALSSAERARGDAWMGNFGKASTGPRSFERGETLLRARLPERAPSFNGAALFRARREHHTPRPYRVPARFNGAALFRARRGTTIAPWMARTTRFNGAALFRARRANLDILLLTKRPELQRGRALSSAESEFFVMGNHELVHASTGPRSFERGEQGGLTSACRAGAASTGPRSFERGETLANQLPAGTAKLQRGRALSSAERAISIRRRCAPRSSFNGAALFRARRGPDDQGPGPVRDRASTGPRSFERGEPPEPEPPPLLPDASTGPRSFERGERGRGGSICAMKTSFNGAALFRARRV